MNRKDLQGLARIRLEESTALLKLGLFDGAYYLAGYAVECALKACIAKATKRGEFPDKRRVDSSHTHDMRELVKLAGLEDVRRELAARDSAFRNYWDTIQSWSEHSRYRRHDLESAQKLVTAISDRRHGVFTWIKRHW